MITQDSERSLLFFPAIRAGAIENRVGGVQRELLTLRQVLCKQGGVAACHVKGSAAFYTAHVQRTLAAFGVKVLKVDLPRAALAAAPHFFFRL